LLRQIAELEELVDQAAGEEDFDKAATIQEQVDVLRAQLEAL
jgi:protein-arginine kinase activator protein McsA